ncbi:MAG: AEC family transporter [Anaerolineae bacterium]
MLSDVFARLAPVLLLLALGQWMQRRRFVTETSVEQLKKIVVNLTLPAVLFHTFLEMELQPAYLAIFALVFLLCVALLALGRLLQPQLGKGHPYFPFLLTGFEYGMLGVGLFGTAYGLEQLGYIAVIDLGHELFIWFVFLGFLLVQRDGIREPRRLLRAFATAPVILGILSGLAFNALGLRSWLSDFFLSAALLATLERLGSVTGPLILLIIGYGIALDRRGIREAWPIVAVRLGLLIPLALLLNTFVLDRRLGLAQPFQSALFTLLVLPPPFILPLYMPDLPEERRYVNNVLTVHTVASIAVFTLYSALTA